jgi:hypothetical protein
MARTSRTASGERTAATATTPAASIQGQAQARLEDGRAAPSAASGDWPVGASERRATSERLAGGGPVPGLAQQAITLP